MPDLRMTWGDFPGGYATEVVDGTTTTIGTTDAISGAAGGVDVNVEYSETNEDSQAFALNLATFDDPGDGLPPSSQIKLFSDIGSGDTNNVAFTFTPTDPLFAGAVSDLTFRIDDIDAGAVNDVDASDAEENNHEDIVEIRAFDASGNPLDVTVTPGAGMTQTGGTTNPTLTGVTQGVATDGAQSALISITGPVARVEIDYSNGATDAHEILISDMLFSTVDAGGNSDPNAVDDLLQATDVDTPIVGIDVLANDSDPDSDPLTVTAVSADNGDVVINGDGTLTYTPDLGFTGDDTISYTISDGNGGTDTAIVPISVGAGNNPPDAVDDLLQSTPVDTPIVGIDVLANDSDPDSDPLTVTAVSADNGDVVINGDGTLTYTPDLGFTGDDTISYTISDGNGGTDTAIVPISVGAANSPPDAVDDAPLTTGFETPIVGIDVLANDSDPDSDPLVITAATAPNGTVVINPDGTLEYIPADDFLGLDTVTYTITDGNGGFDTATFTVQVGDPNDPPVAVDDPLQTTPFDTPIENIVVLDNDSDPEDDPLSVTDATATNGDVVINGDGTLTYTPDAGFEGDDTITYTITDGISTDTAIVPITVEENQLPDAVDDALQTTDVNTAIVGIDVLGNDTDPEDDTLTVTAASALNGTVVINGDGTLTYTPNTDFTGDDTISYTITDSISGTDSAIVPVTITDPVAPDGIVEGTAGDDTIDLAYLGDPEGDRIDAGDEILPGEGPEDDIVQAGAGNDSIDTFLGDDDVDAGTGDDTVNTGAGDDVVLGDAGADVITTEDGSDTVDGGIGDDIIDTSGTAPELDDNLFPTEPEDAAPDDDRDSVLGGEGNDSITTGDDADTIDAGDGDDTVIAGIDNDSVLGGDGIDSLVGGEGADTIEGGAGDDVIQGGTLGLSDYVGDDANFPVTVDGTEFLSDPNQVNDRDSLVGGDGNDIISGGDDADTILGGADNDTIDGGIDDDSINAGAGDDSIIGGHGSDFIDGFTGDDFIDASSSTLLFEGEPDATELAGLELNDRDTVFGGDGNDTILGGDDEDSLSGGSGNDSIDGGIDDDEIFGRSGDDFIEGGDGDDTIEGGAGFDTLLGGAGDDVIRDGEFLDPFDGDDLIEGGDGDDSISADLGSDTVTGGEGADTINTGADRDLIIGATAGDVVDGGETGDDFDTLDLTTATADQAAAGGSLNVVITSADGEDGFVEFLDGVGAVTDTMTFDNIENIIGTDNNDPTAVADFEETPVNTEITNIDVIANDFDTDGDDVSYVPGSATTTDGTITENADGTLNFTPNLDFEGPATVTYTVTDGSGGTDEGVLTIDVIGNQPPEPNNDIASTPVETPVVVDVLANDSDPDDDPLTPADEDPLTVTAATAPNGTVVINPDGTLEYTPDALFEGTDIITYTVEDTDGNTATAEVIMTVGEAPENEAPDAVDDADEVTPINTLLAGIDVLGNDSDPDSDPIEVIDAFAPNGVVTINADGTLDYQPNPGFEGEDTITYQITDNISGNDTAVLTVLVGEPNTDPDADPDTAATDPVTPITIFPLGNDTDPENDPLTIVDADAPNGTVVISPSGQSLTYTPDAGFEDDVDTITYTISDGNGGEDTTTIQVLVGTPVLDGIVEGTAGDDVIDDTYLGDPEGDQVDNDDAITPESGSNDDEIQAGDGNDTIDAGEGNDTVDAGEGDDVVETGDGNDFVIGDGFGNPATVNGDDSIDTGDGDDTVFADDFSSPTTGNDTVTTGDGNDSVGTGGGDDVIDTSGSTPDATGLDEAPFPSIPTDDDPEDDRDFVDAAEGNDSIITGDDDDTIIGGEGDDTIFSGIDDDSVIGDGGNDSIVDIQGADFIDGGDGDDTIFAGIDTFTDYVGDDPNLPITDSGITFVTDPDTDDGKDTVFGGAGNDIINTGDDADSIDGGDDNDTINAGIDDDTVRGGDGDDSILGGHGSDTIDGGGGDDFIDAGHTGTVTDFEDEPDATEPVGLEFNDRDSVTGGSGNDTILGGDDNDTISGGNGNDVLDGGIDDDLILGGNGFDEIFGGDGSDTIDSGNSDDTVTGGDGADSIFTGGGEDSIIGATAGDTIDGGDGPSDFDTLDLTGAGELENAGGRITVTYDAPGSEGGVVNFLDAADVVTGTARFDDIENVIPCFTPGTMIATPTGERAVEDLKVGDRVITRDNGIQEIRWAGAKELSGAQLAANDHLQPVLIQAGALGDNLPERDILVSPQHRMLLTTDQATMYFEEREVLVAAKHLTMLDGVDRVESSGTTYIHIMFEQHEVVLSNGTWSESFQPGEYTLDGIGKEQRDEILELFPELATQVGTEAYQSARRTLKKYEAALLIG